MKMVTILDLLTSNTIVRWLGSNVKPNSGQIDNVSIVEVLKYRESSNVCLFIPARTNFVEVLDIFDDYKNTPKKLEAIIITENGRDDEEFLGIITNWDLPVIYDALDRY